jgi:trans-aconitate methyltransferase
MVLQQLTDHTKLLQALMSEINTIKQQIAITDIVSKNWRDQADRSIQELKDDVEFILEDEGGINQRLKSIEDNTKIEEKSSLKIKAFWGLLGGAVVVIVDLAIRVVSLISSKLQIIMQNPPQ